MFQNQIQNRNISTPPNNSNYYNESVPQNGVFANKMMTAVDTDVIQMHPLHEYEIKMQPFQNSHQLTENEGFINVGQNQANL